MANNGPRYHYPSCHKDQLTGKVRFRTNWRGKVIMQVQFFTETCQPKHSDAQFPRSVFPTAWRDATIGDVTLVDGFVAVNTDTFVDATPKVIEEPAQSDINASEDRLLS